MSYFNSFHYGEEVRVIGGEYEGAEGIFLKPMFEIWTEERKIIIVEPHFVDGYDNTPMTPPISETTTLTRSPPLASSMSTTGENIVNVESHFLAGNNTTIEASPAMSTPRAIYKSRRRHKYGRCGKYVHLEKTFKNLAPQGSDLSKTSTSKRGCRKNRKSRGTRAVLGSM
ncbi:uncharacterized protein LOC128132201 isoform X1 [Lactuca sativa]|uniref:uncharacterized protein LOC111913009 isoform X1 n=1 Tax=Lactuca sativa TaxID=4236 RepID=UPI000CADC572|nr:uncharacterized protein LOC111913009 isoform X1 [Lactuca sativa]XP_052624054.1 uncharacterized protein LOC128132055 isoform X1 [Lactuca sativa]XP_052624401.1 uncharacterized protein LOC128132199 isoform X1 [Lactuca sativa]XP_052624403.1 uncharacterized protein LOC128132200 isoform X1 [Lactuca sativa]XP_052624405.1 uncharacterized protein LOC128132201 isoform X1 [Lactuca sativa]